MSRDAFCLRPFACFEIAHHSVPRGDVYVCCPDWLPTPIGNMQRQSVAEIWNSPVAQEIRHSVLDGSYRHCRRDACPFLPSRRNAPEVAWLIGAHAAERIVRERRVELDHGPLQVNCAYDRSCTLSCPSCRTGIVVEHRAAGEILAIQAKVRAEALRDARQLSLIGSGDPFGSPFCRSWLLSMRRGEAPRLENIHIHTNGQLWTPSLWQAIPAEVRALIGSTEISIDAAMSATYAVNRRGVIGIQRG